MNNDGESQFNENIEIPDVNDLAELIKYSYLKFLDKNDNKTKIDDSNDEDILFSFTDPKDFILASKENSFPKITQFINYLGNMKAEFQISTALDENNDLLSIDFYIKRTKLSKEFKEKWNKMKK